MSKRNKVRIIAVCAPQQHRSLKTIFSQSSWEVALAGSVAEATSLITRNETPVVLCEASLPDGTWQDLAKVFKDWQRPPRLLIMTDSVDDHLWAEVLQVGYDLLMKPLNPQEVFPVLGFAWRSWTQNRLPASTAQALTAAQSILA